MPTPLLGGFTLDHHSLGERLLQRPGLSRPGPARANTGAGARVGVHVVGHSSGALIAAQMAADSPELVHSLMLIEPAACGPFFVPAFAELGERFIGPAMGAFAAGDLAGAFDTLMRGVGGDRAREIIEQRFGRAGHDKALRESRFFFNDEVPACTEWQFESNVAEITEPVLPVVTSLLGGTPAAVPDHYAQASAIKLLPLGIPQVIVVGRTRSSCRCRLSMRTSRPQHGLVTMCGES